MKIVVCIKQVPDVDDIKWTKENNLDREQMLSRVNEQDEWALNYARSIKNKTIGTQIIAVSMGPNKAKDALEYALAKGASRAILLSDKRFSGSDTIVTAKILAKAIKKYVPDFDIILTGQAASDGDTEQTPVSLATLLNIADVTNVYEVCNMDKNLAIVKQKINEDTNLIEAKTPCLVAVKAPCENCTMPKIEDYVKSQVIKIETYNADDLEFNKNEIGILGSPTMVYKAFRPQNTRETKEISENPASVIIDMVSKVQI